MMKFKSQALHIIRIKYCNAGGSGNSPSLIPALWTRPPGPNILSPSVQTNNDHHQVCTQNQIAIESYESAMVSFYSSLNLPQLLIGLITFCRSILTFMYLLAFSRDIHQWVSTQQLRVPVFANLGSQVKVSKYQKQFFLKLHCPQNERNIRQNSALASQ